MTIAATENVSIEDLDFELPPELVAQRPLAERDACRLLCVRRTANAGFEARTFRDLPALLRPGDVLVRNVSRVIPARLTGTKRGTGARCEVLLVEPAADGAWWALVRPGRRLPAGAQVEVAAGHVLEVRDVAPDGRRLVAALGEDLLTVAAAAGAMPLPPYVQRPAEAADRDDYQTVYAAVEGSVAAPTAGLHFTADLLARIAARGVTVADVVLHVGMGTFAPIRTADPLQHPMHAETFAVAQATLDAVDAARRAGGRVVAVGTTVVRTLESVARWQDGTAGAAVEARATGAGISGRTRIFLHPPQRIRTIDALVTNFHLPRSSLLLLVDAFAGRDLMRAAYAHAVRARFRFFSYGDAMWIE